VTSEHGGPAGEHTRGPGASRADPDEPVWPYRGPTTEILFTPLELLQRLGSGGLAREGRGRGGRNV